MCDNIQKRCRICLDVESSHVSILGDPTISLQLKSCLALTISSNDHLPKTICMTCVTSLNQFYNFQLNAKCSQDWLESSLQDRSKKIGENKMPLQPLPDSEYNSDSLLEFLNNTANIEEYLNNLGKEDIPCIVNMLDKNESMELTKNTKKNPSPKKSSKIIKMEIDVLDSDFKMIKELIKKDNELKVKANESKIESFICYGCKINFDSIQKLLQHTSVCDIAGRTCVHCNVLFDSKYQMQQHSISHNTSLPLSCNCGESFQSREKLIQHHKICHLDYGGNLGCIYRCLECKDTFKERFQLYKHAKQHINKAEQKICDICGHIFVGSEALIKHRKKQHGISENVMFRCKICNTTSPDHKAMYLHVKGHTTRPNPMRHLCESCGRSFATHASLMRHSLLHNNKSCDVCNKTFRDETLLKEHLTEHSQTVMCEKCGQSVNSYELNLHSCAQ